MPRGFRWQVGLARGMLPAHHASPDGPMTRTALLSLGLILGAGCFLPDKSDDDDEDEDEDDGGWGSGSGWGDDDTGGGGSGSGSGSGSGGGGLDASVTWGSSSLQLDIEGGAGAYVFGIAETHSGCADYCWTGEDCVYGHPDSGLEYCHPMGATGGELYYGGYPTELAEGEETVFPDSSYEDLTTYYLMSLQSEECWVWGAEPGYYDGLGCTEI